MRRHRGQSQAPGGSEPRRSSEPAAGEPVEIRWFCCLGAGDDPAQVEVEQAVVDAFNESQDDIHVTLEVVEYEEAYRPCSTVQLNSPDPPDVVGPAGISGAEAFHGQWLDLQPLVDSTGYDLSQFAEGAVDFYRSDEFGLEGLPFAIFPSMLYYQRDMFDEADLEYPPHAYGDPYVLDGEEVTWNFDTLRELALRLTVDENGNDATSADFDPEAIVQWGYEPQYQDLRAQGSYLGSGSLVADDGTTAQIPEQWAGRLEVVLRRCLDRPLHHERGPAAGSDDRSHGQSVPVGQRRDGALAPVVHVLRQRHRRGRELRRGPELGHRRRSGEQRHGDLELQRGHVPHPGRQQPSRRGVHVPHLPAGRGVRTSCCSSTAACPAARRTRRPSSPGLTSGGPRVSTGRWRSTASRSPTTRASRASCPNYAEAFDAIKAELIGAESTPDLDMDAEIAAFTEELQEIFDRAE